MTSVEKDAATTAASLEDPGGAASRDFPADRAAPRAATAWLRGFAHGLSEPSISDAELCLDELVTNVVRYAWADGAPHAVTVRFERSPSEFALTVEDDGRRFDPREASLAPPAHSLAEAEIGGRGLMLVRSIAPRLDYERRHGRNRVTVAFPRSDVS
jgi:anti-sigma regulatory factor (Ser/Thr protein kinase)